MNSVQDPVQVHCVCRISSINNSRGRLFLFSHQKGAIIQGRRLIEGRLLFEEIRYIFFGPVDRLRLSCVVSRSLLRLYFRDIL